ncbi:MAG: O-antigen ligase family protein [Rhodospirillales bacterium]|nr:O-antigen ligase family protein [Rhodospirillales bacterium]
MSITRISSLLLFFFAIALQVQITLLASENYIGLRVNLADLILPFTGVFILGTLIFKTSCWPRWNKPFGYWAPALLSLIIGLGLIHGYLVQGEWSQWALINKGVGCGVLMAYLLAGAWFGTNRPDLIKPFFILPFMAFVVLVIAIEGLFRGLYHLEILQSLSVFGYSLGRDMAGLMANRNAFAFLYLCTLTLSSLQLIRQSALPKNEKTLYAALWFLLPLFLLLNLSRAALLVIIPLSLYLLVTHRPIFLRLCLPLVIVGLFLAPFANFKKVEKVLGNLGKVSNIEAQIENSDGLAYEESVYLGDQVRLQIMKDSWALIKAHPITGAGIGTALKVQHDEERQYISVIDNTPLWILTETGPFGLLGFASVYVCMLMALFKSAKKDEKEAAFRFGLIGVLLAFGVYSLLHEILYIRFLWFFLGLGLASPIAHLQR